MGEVKRELSADDILATTDLENIEVEVPEWKGVVHLRLLPADEGLALSEEIQGLPKGRQTEAIFMLLAACLADAKGQQLFTTEDQLAKLRKRSPKVLIRLQRTALELQGWSGAAPKNG